MKKQKITALILAGTMLMSHTPIYGYAEEGNLVKWSSLIGSTGSGSFSLTTSDSVNHVETLLDGSMLVTGIFDGNKVTDIPELKGKQDGYLAKYDRNGNELFRTFVGGSATDLLNYGIASNHGGYIAVGYSQSDDQDFLSANKGGKDGVIVKLNESGQIEKTVNFGGSDADELKAILNAPGGGYIVAGYSNSNDGDLTLANKTTTDRDGILAKYDKDLNLEWVTKVGGSEGESANKRMDELHSVVRVDDGYYAVGYGNSDGGDLENIHLGKKDILLVKIDEQGQKQWVKTYGGSEDDEASVVMATARSSSDDERTGRETTQSMGLVLAGTTSSQDGTFADSKTIEGKSAFILRLDEEGEVIWKDTLSCSENSVANGLQVIGDGYVITGTFTKNDLDFTGQTLNGKKNGYISYYSTDGNRLNTLSFGGNDQDEILGVERTAGEDFVVYGKTSSTGGFVSGTKGKSDGFLACLDGEQVRSYVTYKYLVPVQAWKVKEDQPSMMAPMLYQDAYVEKVGEQYQVTFYFINAAIMGTTVSAKTLGAVSYESNGSFVDALKDEYDEKTQVKTVKILADSLDTPILIHIEDAMGDIRLSFNTSEMQETEIPPYFAPVQIQVPDFDATYKTNVGGSDYDYVNDTVTLSNGNVVIVGQTYSNDGDFAGGLKGGSSGFVLEYDQDQQLVQKMLIGGTQYDSIAYISGISPIENGGYYVTGSYAEGEGVAPTGDFADLKTEDSVHGMQDAFVARYDENHQQMWIKGFSGSNYDQAKTIKTTEDGGCIILIETNSFDGDMKDRNAGLFDLALVKYDKEGTREWIQCINGVNIESSKLGIDILANGNYIVGGIFSSTNGDFSEVDRYGNLFDLFACEISKDGEILKMQSYGGDHNDYFSQILATKDGGFLMVGDTKSVTDTFENAGTGYSNAYILKCNANLEKEWVKVIKSSENSEAISAVETEEHYYVLGDSRGNDFDFENLNKGNMDVFFAKLDKNGTLLDLKTIGGTDADYSVKLNQVNSYQLGILVYDESNDGDFAEMNRGKFDGSYLVYSYQEQPEEKEEPDVPPTDSLPSQDPETPDAPDVPSDSEGKEEDKDTTGVNTSDATAFGSVFGMMGVAAAGCVGILWKKKRV